MAGSKDTLWPSQELVNKVRAIAAYQLAFSPEMAKSLGETGEKGLLRAHLRDQLNSFLN